MVRFCLATILLGSTAFTSPLAANEPRVVLGEVQLNVSPHRPELVRSLRSALEEELSDAKFQKLGARDRFILSATLVELAEAKQSSSARATCVVSVAIRRKNESTLAAVVRGKATAEGDERDSTRASALRAAAHSAVKRVPDALASLKH